MGIQINGTTDVISANDGSLNVIGLPSLNVSGIVTATAFVGDGSGLTNIAAGARGPQGPQGPQGAQGAQGASGAQGAAGVSLTLGTSQSVSGLGTAVSFTGIPSTAKKIGIVFSRTSTTGNSNYIIQLGTSSGYTLTGYDSSCTQSGGGNVTSSIGLIATNGIAAAHLYNGVVELSNITGNTWVSSGILISSSVNGHYQAGNIALSGTLDSLRITTVAGTDTWDAGTINIYYF